MLFGRICSFVCLVCAIPLTGSWQADNSVSRHFTIEKLGDGIWAAINNTGTGGHGICNAGIIDLGDKTLVFDPFMNLDAAEDLKQAARELTGTYPSWVVNSHHHNDHIRGNQVFLPASIVSTASIRKDISQSEPKSLAWERENAGGILAMYRKRLSDAKTEKEKEDVLLWLSYFEGMVESGPKIQTTLPDMIFSDSLRIYGSRRSIKLMEFRQGHTDSDVILYADDAGIVFTGDLFFNHAHPHLTDGDPDSLIKHIMQMDAEPGMKTFVPGHGPVGDNSSLRRLAVYVRDLQQIVQEGKRKGFSDSAIIRSPIPIAYASWTFGRQFFEDNIEFLCARGKKP